MQKGSNNRGERKSSSQRIKEETKGYGQVFLAGGLLLFIFGQWMYTIFPLPLIALFLLHSMGCLLSIRAFLHVKPLPYVVGHGRVTSRALEPSELCLEERKILSFIDSEHGRKIIIETNIYIFLISMIIKIISDHGKNLKPVYGAELVICIILTVIFIVILFLFPIAVCFTLGRLMLSAYKNWDTVQAMKPWPIDKPYGTPLFKKRKELGIEDYKKHLIKLSKKNIFIKEFLEKYSFENLSLFLSNDRFSKENLKKISELDNPTEYFEFLEKVSYEDDKFRKFSIGHLIDGFHSRLEEEPEAYYESYERLFMKAEGDLLEVLGKESFNDFILENTEFFIERMERDPDWKKKVEKLSSVMSRHELKELVEKLPDTSFGREFREYIEGILEKKPSKKRGKKAKNGG